ncbi:MAG: hypothetical protein JO257_32015 [Deltaproteobacteria bacterium]|nr:hypothetical protein [Deltaproteobacteria bacterium]
MFHVFVEGAVDRSPGGTARLAEAIAKHYGLPVEELEKRLDAGRFRVKGNVDRATADTYVRDLERLGACCSVEDAETSPSRATPLPVRPATPPAGLPVARPTTPPAAAQPPPRPSGSILGDQPPSRPSAPPSALASMPRPSTPPPVAGAYTSGLAAGFGEAAHSGLGALEREDATFSLGSVDGTDAEEAAIEKSPEPMFAPPPAKDAGGPTKKAKPKDEPVDMFAPPDAESDNFKVDLAEEDKKFDRKRTTTPPAAAPVVPPTRASQPNIAAQAPVTSVKSKLGPLADEKVRMIAGALLAVLLGFLPAHLYASSREKAAYAEIDQKLQSIQIAADSPEAYSALDKTRSDFLERKRDERRNIAVIALVIWALVGGGLAYGWFRRVPWDDL